MLTGITLPPVIDSVCTFLEIEKLVWSARCLLLAFFFPLTQNRYSATSGLFSQVYTTTFMLVCCACYYYGNRDTYMSYT